MSPYLLAFLLTTTSSTTPHAEASSPTVVSATTVLISTTIVSETAILPEAPILVGNGPRTLETTLMLAEKHPILASNVAGVDQARYTVRAAKGARLFTLTGDAEAGVQFYDDEGEDGTSGVGNIGLSFNQPLTDGGRRRGAVMSAEERFGSATENLAWQKRLRRYAAASAHINLWLAQELVRNNADNVSQLEDIVTEVRARLGKREATVTEIAEAESRLATARAAQAERIAALGVAQSTYLRDVGESANRVEDPGTGVTLATVTGLQHPLISAAQHGVEEAEGIIRQRKAAYWPTLDLRSRVSHNAFAGTKRDDPATQGQLTVNLGYTFVDGGVTSAETSAAKASRRQAESQLTNTKLEVEAALLNAQSTYTEAERRLQESIRAQTESARVIGNLTQEVRQGNRTVRDLLDARRDQLAASNGWAQAYASRVLSSYDVERWQ